MATRWARRTSGEQRDEVDGGGDEKRDEQGAYEPCPGVRDGSGGHPVLSADGHSGGRGGLAPEAVAEAAVDAGCQPGPRKTRPARSRQLPAARRSLAMAAYSWVATRSGLYVAMFLVSP